MSDFIAINADITLSPFRPEDKPSLLRYLNHPELSRNTLHIPHPYTETDAENWLALTRERREKMGVVSNWAIRHREEGLIGGIGAMVKAGLDGHLDEIGYWLAAPFWGRGIMTEVVQKFTEWLFASRPALVRIEGRVFSFNIASARVLEKAGYEREGYLRKEHIKNGVHVDTILLTKIRAEE